MKCVNKSSLCTVKVALSTVRLLTNIWDPGGLKGGAECPGQQQPHMLSGRPGFGSLSSPDSQGKRPGERARGAAHPECLGTAEGTAETCPAGAGGRRLRERALRYRLPTPWFIRQGRRWTYVHFMLLFSFLIFFTFIYF